MKKMMSNYDYFIKANTTSYKGEWIAIARKKIVAHGKDAEVVFKKAKKICSSGDFSLAKVPNEQVLVLIFRHSS
ncbi:succinyl-CoA synthetase subunit alpha [Candidatus Gottesmanbacteria bacterium]|nr:succinyl-CoA synthetase subunit alpha [Candidatus Gottesmanbacteria bacterium]